MPRIWISLLEFRFADLSVRDLSLEMGWWHIQKQSINNSDLFPHASLAEVLLCSPDTFWRSLSRVCVTAETSAPRRRILKRCHFQLLIDVRTFVIEELRL